MHDLAPCFPGWMCNYDIQILHNVYLNGRIGSSLSRRLVDALGRDLSVRGV